jgi:dTDP-L-rhamnose 4-epimerase
MSWKVLVTGGAGFIGSHLVDALVENGYDVTVLDNLAEQVHDAEPECLNDDARYVWGDVRDREILEDLLPEADVVSHQASAVGVGQSMYEIEHYVDANARGTATILDIIANDGIELEKFVVASSMSIYGEGAYVCPGCGEARYPGHRNTERLARGEWEHECPDCGTTLEPRATDESKPLDGASVYAVTKRDQEQLVRSVCRAYGIESVALRYFNVYGSRQALDNPYTGVCAIFASRIKNGNPPLVFEDGRQCRDFTHVSDIVGANIAAIESDADDVALNVGTGRHNSIAEVAETLVDMYDADVRPEVTGEYREGDIRHCYADVSRTRDVLDWEPAVELKEGMRELVKWSADREATDNFKKARAELDERGLTGGE